MGSPTPHTPSSSRNKPTPSSSGHSFGGASGRFDRDSSPTPNPKRETFLSGSSQLTKDVFNILQSNNVLLRSSTREQLRCLIDSEIRTYETKLENVQGSVSVLGGQLDQLEVREH